MNANLIVTFVSVIIPAVVAYYFERVDPHTFDRARFFDLFLQLFTCCAALIVIVNAVFPQSSSVIGDSRAFLLVLSLSAVLHSIAAITKMIDGGKARPYDKRNQQL